MGITRGATLEPDLNDLSSFALAEAGPLATRKVKVCMCVCVYACMYLPAYLPIYVSTCLPIYLSTYLQHLSTHLPIYLSTYLPLIYLFIISYSPNSEVLGFSICAKKGIV